MAMEVGSQLVLGYLVVCVLVGAIFLALTWLEFKKARIYREEAKLRLDAATQQYDRAEALLDRSQRIPGPPRDGATDERVH